MNWLGKRYPQRSDQSLFVVRILEPSKDSLKILDTWIRFLNQKEFFLGLWMNRSATGSPTLATLSRQSTTLKAANESSGTESGRYPVVAPYLMELRGDDGQNLPLDAPTNIRGIIARLCVYGISSLVSLPIFSSSLFQQFFQAVFSSSFFKQFFQAVFSSIHLLFSDSSAIGQKVTGSLAHPPRQRIEVNQS